VLKRQLSESGSVRVWPPTGTGPSQAECKRKQHAKELKKAKRTGKELFEDNDDGCFIDPSCAPPKTNKRKARKSASGRAKAQKTVDPI